LQISTQFKQGTKHNPNINRMHVFLSRAMLFTTWFVLSQVLTCALANQPWPRSGGFRKFPPSFSPGQFEVDVKDFFFGGMKDVSSGGGGNQLVEESTALPLPERRPQHDDCGTRTVNFYGRRSPKIVGGTETPYGAYPWQVEIQVFNFDNESFVHHCGGAVIGDKLVLTAAHCLQIPRAEYLRLVIGDHSLQRRDLHEHSYRVEKLIIHPDYRKEGPYSNDIAIIKLKSNDFEGIAFNSHVRPICLPDPGHPLPTGTWCSVTGWGVQRAEDLGSIAPVLRVAEVPLLETRLCRTRSIERNQRVLDTMLCAGHLEGGTDACGGDSGGPLACEINGRFYLTGIVSWGDGCAKKNSPGLYTRVVAYLDWIQGTMDALGDRTAARYL
jgi:Trypsin